MILAYDQSLWHPNDILLFLWFLSAVAALVPLFLLVRDEAKRVIYFAGAAFPLLTLFAVNVYLDYGRSGTPLGDGKVGLGARIDVVASLGMTAWQSVWIFWPTLVAVWMAYWSSVRKERPVIFWFLFALVVAVQLALAFLLYAVFDPL